ncbi:MAG: polyprenyl diphosphate synthase [Thermovirgaceae bacterium]|jgi:undecaprenyl diphosphate synthase|nr:polyprenyl diphosphate synthase [Synergistales bacterium]MDI9391958.1 polyprenyl diphosphate synthase [Synergistota bacterium]MDY0179594.1 polyprenyl diphosphate synthase [Synergistaceae bacterium]MDD3829374.1 polyprenyl diphosphate synthase [Synergistales bacterium]MDD5513819.1 polyprenyl diphosphate synthase [Synergistales bacterium]
MQVETGKKVPSHVAVIMDGNGRWALQRGLPRLAGHREGAKAVERVIRAAAASGIEYLSLFAFSTENWRRPKAEIEGLMSLLGSYLRSKKEELVKNRIRMVFSGRIEQLPQDLRQEIDLFERATAPGDLLTVAVCLNYGGRQEIVDAVNGLLKRGFNGEITEDLITANLYRPEIPDPDLLIRTSGELRISNFLLWGSAYAELYFTDTLWPDFGGEELQKAIDQYSGRERRYGAV